VKIDSVELRIVEMPLLFPFETSFGRMEKKTALIVSAQSEGMRGLGEIVANPKPDYSEETIETCWHILRDFMIPEICREPVDHPRDFPRRVAGIRRHNMAKAGLEAALWDLHCQIHGVSLAQAFGGTREKVEVGVSLGLEPTTKRLLERIETFVGLGYRRIKIKIKPGFDLEMTREVRRAFPGILLQVDANSAYLPEHAPIFQAMDDLRLLLIEQPLGEDDIVDHAQLQNLLKTPICLDESIVQPHDARKAIDLGSCRVINIKQGRMGGITNSIETHDLCRDRGVPVWCGGMLETGIGRILNLSLAALPNFTLPGDISASDRYFAEDVIAPPVTLNADGTIDVPRDHGVSPRVNLTRLSEVTRKRETFAGA
jgi:O-succinylbenzoate synthase